MYSIIHETITGKKTLSLIKHWSRNMKVSYTVEYCDSDIKVRYISSHRKPEKAAKKYIKLTGETFNNELVNLCNEG